MLGKIYGHCIHMNTKSVCSIWFTQAQFSFRTGHAQAGENPELRSLFYKLASILKLPITPIFVFDGPARPSVKRGVNVITKPNWLTKPLQELISAFGFQFYTVSMP
jgi:Holliday junction resolvase YEN1